MAKLFASEMAERVCRNALKSMAAMVIAVNIPWNACTRCTFDDDWGRHQRNPTPGDSSPCSGIKKQPCVASHARLDMKRTGELRLSRGGSSLVQ